MRRRGKVGTTTLRWAQGPGKQSGFWALNAIAIATLPFIALLRPECHSDLLACSSEWDQILLLPRVLFGPAVVLAFVMAGSWWAQRRHAAVDDRYFAALENADQPELPPGHFDASPLHQDLVKRTLRGVALGALLGGVSLVAIGITSLGRRGCDPWAIPQSGLAVCRSAGEWTDLVIAFELWILVGFAFLAALIWYTRSTSVSVVGIPKRRRRLRRPSLRGRPQRG